MLGTILLIGMVICGYENFPPWVLVPGTTAAVFIGLHFPPGKAQMLRARGIYWQVLFYSFPTQGIFMATLFGLGWGVGALFK